MAITTASGTHIYIGPAVSDAQADTRAEFLALSGYTEIGQVETIGEFGDQSNDVTFAALGDARVRHAKGARDAGQMTVTCGHDPLDVGQDAANGAQETNFQFAIKVVLPDGPAGFSNTELYFRALGSSARLNVGANDNVIRRTYNFGITSQVFEQAASA